MSVLGPDLPSFTPARDALPEYRTDLIWRHNLVAVGVGVKVRGGRITGEPCIKAFVTRKLPPSQLAPGAMVPERIPNTDLLTDVEQTGIVTSPPSGSMPFDNFAFGRLGTISFRRRPLSGGDSISRLWGVSGTVGTACTDVATGRPALLTCNHVAAALGLGHLGDLVVQPAVEDGGRALRDVCGALTRFVPIWFSGPANHVDGALVAVAPGLATAAIDWLGQPSGVRPAKSLVPLETIFKVGRTTGLTSGQVVAVDVTGWLVYPPPLGIGASALFDDLIVTTAMARFGDSGALALDAQRRAVGLLFGGSLSHTFLNDFSRVEQQLGVRLFGDTSS